MVKYNYTSQSNPNKQRKTVPSNRAVIRKRYSNAGVRKALAAKPTKPKPDVKNNKNAITVLSKQVKKLQLQRYGFKQYQHQFIKELPGDNAANYVSPIQTQPIAFMVNDFYLDSKIWTGGILNGAPQLTAIRKFDKVDNVLPIDKEYLWNHKQQLDTVSTVHYMPVTTTMRFRVQYTSDATFDAPVRVRIQVFKFKNAVMNGKFAMALPYNLGAYWHMCDKDPTTRNHLNTATYHDVVVDKSVLVTPTFLHNGLNTIDKYINCKIYFPAKEVKFDQSALPTDQHPYNIIPSKDQYWCLISTDTNTLDRVKVFLERWNVWRDINGVGS